MTIRKATNLEELTATIKPTLTMTDQGVQLKDEAALRETVIDSLAHTAALTQDEATKDAAQWIIREVAQAVGIIPASIQTLYEAMGRAEVQEFTVPAVNIRGITYDVARTLARSALKIGCGALIFEISTSEIGYTQQRPSEYTACVLAGLIKEGFKGPAFIQGDHFQVKATNYRKDRVAEIDGLKAITREAIQSGFYNIDIDASTLVDLSKPTVDEQQADNYGVTAEMIEFIRNLEPAGITVSVGGEIGEKGNKNSTVEELVAYMDGLLRTLRPGSESVSKISVQTGTRHGGVVLPDGAMAKVKIDFDLLQELSDAARARYDLCGAVQHGASTLPDEVFDSFAKRMAAEIHLATEFQNIIYDHPAFPEALKNEIYAYLKDKHATERKPDQSDEQFFYQMRKKGFGPFKERLWTLPTDVLGPIFEALEKKFDFLMDKLHVANTDSMVAKHVQPVPVHAPIPEALDDHLG